MTELTERVLNELFTEYEKLCRIKPYDTDVISGRTRDNNITTISLDYVNVNETRKAGDILYRLPCNEYEALKKDLSYCFSWWSDDYGNFNIGFNEVEILYKGWNRKQTIDKMLETL